MTIEFLCPNGHQLTAKVALVGKPGKCPKCGSKFVVPDPGEDDESDEAAAKPAPKTETIDFLCPNGHRLNGPASLQGKPGQCPHCGQKFRIPSYDDEEAEDEEADNKQEEQLPFVNVGPPSRFGGSSKKSAGPLDDIPVGSVVDDDDGPAAQSASTSGVIDLSGSAMAEIVPDDLIEADDAIEVKNADIISDSDADMMPPSASRPGNVPPPKLQHPVAKAFMNLWARREPGSEVELHLREGGTVTAVRFAPTLSGSDFGVFASQDGDDHYCVTMVAWDSVSRVGFHKLKELPKSVFE